MIVSIATEPPGRRKPSPMTRRRPRREATFAYQAGTAGRSRAPEGAAIRPMAGGPARDRGAGAARTGRQLCHREPVPPRDGHRRHGGHGRRGRRLPGRHPGGLPGGGLHHQSQPQPTRSTCGGVLRRVASASGPSSDAGAGRSRQFGLRHRVAGPEIRGASGPGVPGDRPGRVLDADRHREVGEGGQVEVDRVRGPSGAPVGIVTEVRPPKVSGLSLPGLMASPPADAATCAERIVSDFAPKALENRTLQPLPAQRAMDGPAKRRIGEPRLGRHVDRLGQPGRGRPGSDPAAFIGRGTRCRPGDERRAGRTAGRGPRDAACLRGIASLSARSSPGRS